MGIPETLYWQQKVYWGIRVIILFPSLRRLKKENNRGTGSPFKTRRILILTALIVFSMCTASVAQLPAGKYREVDKLLTTGLMTDAKTVLEKLQQKHRKDTLNSEYWLRYSKASYALFRYDDARLGIDRAIEISSGKSRYYFEKGLLYNKLGNLDSALAALRNAVRIDRKGEYFFWKGVVNQRLQNTAEAELDYRQAVEKKFESAELYTNLAILLSGKEKNAEALALMDKAVATNEKYARAFSARSKINFSLLNIEASCADSKMAMQLGHNNDFQLPDSVCNGSFKTQMAFAAEVFFTNKLYKESVTAYSKLIDSGILKSDYFLNRGYCFYKLGNYPNAEKDYQQALLLPNAATDLIYNNLSLLSYDLQDYPKAIAYSTKRIALNPKNHVPYIDRGLSYRKLKDYKLAEADFNKSLAIKPDFFRAFGYRAFLFLELKEYAKAYEDARKAVALNAEYGYGYLVLALVKMQLGLKDYCPDFYNAKKYGEPGGYAGIKTYCE